jgi:hypothetical protein
VLGVRPDFQLCVLDRPPYYQLVATELEICPSAHGFAHALQLGYGLDTDLVAAFARLLGGRELLFAGTSQWSEFLFEQLAFCQALAERGARARALRSADRRDRRANSRRAGLAAANVRHPRAAGWLGRRPPRQHPRARV